MAVIIADVLYSRLCSKGFTFKKPFRLLEHTKFTIYRFKIGPRVGARWQHWDPESEFLDFLCLDPVSECF